MFLDNYIDNFKPYDKARAGYIIFLIHNAFIFSLVCYLFIGKINYLYYIAVIVWIIIIGFQLYYKGCVLIKLEKKMFQSKEYNGIWEHIIPLFTKKNDINYKQKKHNIIRCIGLLFCFVIFLRLIFG